MMTDALLVSAVELNELVLVKLTLPNAKILFVLKDFPVTLAKLKTNVMAFVAMMETIALSSMYALSEFAVLTV